MDIMLSIVLEILPHVLQKMDNGTGRKAVPPRYKASTIHRFWSLIMLSYRFMDGLVGIVLFLDGVILT